MKFIIALATLSIASALKVERDPLLTWAPTPSKDPFDMNYFVPHFGEDGDISNTKASAATAEAKLGHVWNPAAPGDPPPTDYFVPHFGTDQDVKDSLGNLATQEKLHGTWNYPKDAWF